MGAFSFNLEMMMEPTCFEGALTRDWPTGEGCDIAVAACAGALLSNIDKRTTGRRIVLFCQ